VRSVYTKQLVTSSRQKYWGKFVDIPDLRLGPPSLAFGTPRGSRDPRLRTIGLVRVAVALLQMLLMLAPSVDLYTCKLYF